MLSAFCVANLGFELVSSLGPMFQDIWNSLTFPCGERVPHWDQGQKGGVWNMVEGWGVRHARKERIILDYEQESTLCVERCGGESHLPSSALLHLTYRSQERRPHTALAQETCNTLARPHCRHMASSVGTARQASLYHVHSASSAGNDTQVWRKAWIRQQTLKELMLGGRLEKGKGLWEGVYLAPWWQYGLGGWPHQGWGWHGVDRRGNHILAPAGSDLWYSLSVRVSKVGGLVQKHKTW